MKERKKETIKTDFYILKNIKNTRKINLGYGEKV